MATRTTVTQLEQFAESIIGATQNSFARYGWGKKEFRKILLRCEDGSAARHARDIIAGLAPASYDASAYGAVLRTWVSDGRFLQANGHPRVLRSRGRNSISTILRIHGFNKQEGTAIKYLVRSKAIKRVGVDRYALDGPKSAKIVLLDNVAIVHAVKCIDALINTILYNILSSNKKLPLPEMKTEVYLPSALHKKYREFAHRQLLAVAHTVDDWLEAHADKSAAQGNKFRAGAWFLGYSDSPQFRAKVKKTK